MASFSARMALEEPLVGWEARTGLFGVVVNIRKILSSRKYGSAWIHENHALHQFLDFSPKGIDSNTDSLAPFPALR